jgi:hypothetical protein
LFVGLVEPDIGWFYDIKLEQQAKNYTALTFGEHLARYNPSKDFFYKYYWDNNFDKFTGALVWRILPILPKLWKTLSFLNAR